DYRGVGPPTGGHAEEGRCPDEEERMNSYPRREFLLRALAACGTPFLMPLASVEGLQKPQAGTSAAAYFGGRTDAARAIGEAYVRQLGLDTSAESIRQASPGALEVIERAATPEKAIA